MGAVNEDCAHYVNVLIISKLLTFSHILLGNVDTFLHILRGNNRHSVHILRGNAPFLTDFSYKN